MSDKHVKVLNNLSPIKDLYSKLTNLHTTATKLGDGAHPDLIPNNDSSFPESTECPQIGGFLNNKRTFVLVDYPKSGETYGYYKGRYPKQVAKKVANLLSKKHNIGNNDQKFVVFTIREITKNSHRKEYKYIGTRIKLNKPNKVEYNGKIIFHNYNILVTKYDDNFNNSFILHKIV